MKSKSIARKAQHGVLLYLFDWNDLTIIAQLNISNSNIWVFDLYISFIIDFFFCKLINVINISWLYSPASILKILKTCAKF